MYHNGLYSLEIKIAFLITFLSGFLIFKWWPDGFTDSFQGIFILIKNELVK